MDFYNVKKKTFKDGTYQIVTYSKTIMYNHVSPQKGRKRVIEAVIHNNIYDNRWRVLKTVKDGCRRSKNKIFDIARSNEWEWFITLTFDPQKVDSFNYEECTKKLSKWLMHMREKNGNEFRYLVVPELHSSGRYHFHGIISSCEGLNFVDSGLKTENGDVIYNIGKYRLGFTTATKIKDTKRVSLYIGKYVTKELNAVTRNHKRYWASRNCKIPSVERYYIDNKYNELDFNVHGSFINQEGFIQYKDKRKNDRFVRYYEFDERMQNEERSYGKNC